MLNAIKIPKKLALSFLIICVSAAAMMAVFFNNIAMIRSSTDGNNLSQTIHSKALTLETALLRQNSQFRGFLVTADPSYLKSYTEARDEYDETSLALEKLLTDPGQLAAVQKSREATHAWRAKWGDRLIQRVKEGQREAAEAEVRAAGKAVLTSAAVLPLRDVRDAQAELTKKNSAQQETAISTALVALVIGGLAMISVAIVLAVMLTRMIATPITRLTSVMGELAAGQNTITVPDVDRGDEVGDMARAVLVFRDLAVAKEAADTTAAKTEAEQKLVVEAISAHLAELADGNLTAQIARDFPDEYAAIKANFNEAITALRDLIASVMESTDSILRGSSEIAQASEDLARRTETNAATLEETSAAVTQMDGRLKVTAQAATRTASRATSTMETVAGGRDIAGHAVQAMERVADSAKGIDDVIEGLDKIAFQTRVLAMNAAVEAGRAGDAGRGFAVVADLVSALAMRAEEEAKRARSQLAVTQSDIGSAVEAVEKVDGALAAISSSVAEVNDLLGSIAVDNQTQSTALTEIAGSIGTMDSATQQNAAMVEETSASARSLASEVARLSDQARRFTITGGSRTPVPPRPKSTASRFSGPIKPLPAAAIRALTPPTASDADDWQSF